MGTGGTHTTTYYLLTKENDMADNTILELLGIVRNLAGQLVVEASRFKECYNSGDYPSIPDLEQMAWTVHQLGKATKLTFCDEETIERVRKVAEQGIFSKDLIAPALKGAEKFARTMSWNPLEVKDQVVLLFPILSLTNLEAQKKLQ